jgi:hypothetical protein
MLFRLGILLSYGPVLWKVALSLSCISVDIPILRKNRILGYYRYMDDISIICNGKATNFDNMLSEFNIVSLKI